MIWVVLEEVFADLDGWMLETNADYASQSLPPLRPIMIRIIGQTALLEANVDLPLVATQDVDAVARWSDDAVRHKLSELLEARGKLLDPLAHEAWMPKDTRYIPFFSGRLVTAELAMAEYVLISKARTAPVKNRVLLTDYLAAGPSPLFLQLARRYAIDLDALL
jgi:hypothetical protein